MKGNWEHPALLQSLWHPEVDLCHPELHHLRGHGEQQPASQPLPAHACCSLKSSAPAPGKLFGHQRERRSWEKEGKKQGKANTKPTLGLRKRPWVPDNIDPQTSSIPRPH